MRLQDGRCGRCLRRLDTDRHLVVTNDGEITLRRSGNPPDAVHFRIIEDAASTVDLIDEVIAWVLGDSRSVVLRPVCPCFPVHGRYGDLALNRAMIGSGVPREYPVPQFGVAERFVEGFSSLSDHLVDRWGGDRVFICLPRLLGKLREPTYE